MNEYNPADQKAGIEYAERVASERFALLGERVTPATKMLMGCAFEAGAAHGRAVPAGWKLVPVKSSIDMEDAGCKAASCLIGLGEVGRVYRAMLAAAPAAPAGWKLAPIEPTPEMLAATSWPGCAGADYAKMIAAAPAAPVAQEPVAEILVDSRGMIVDAVRMPSDLPPGFHKVYTAPPATEQPDTVPRELYTCIGKGGKYELVGKSQGAGELKHQQMLVYRSTETGLLYHRTPDDFHARMTLLAGGAA